MLEQSAKRNKKMHFHTRAFPLHSSNEKQHIYATNYTGKRLKRFGSSAAED
jgi:hypothetical protein